MDDYKLVYGEADRILIWDFHQKNKEMEDEDDHLKEAVVINVSEEKPDDNKSEFFIVFYNFRMEIFTICGRIII
jgi:hypothetical protein